MQDLQEGPHQNIEGSQKGRDGVPGTFGDCPIISEAGFDQPFVAYLGGWPACQATAIHLADQVWQAGPPSLHAS